MHFAEAQNRPYWRCATCLLTFLPPAYHLGPAEERHRYAQHNNDPHDPGYRAFLARLTDCLLPHLRPGAQGLDYGAGPGPTIAVLLGEAGFPVANYDPYFAPDADAMQRTYDFITCSETAEHFYCPAREFARLDQLLRAGGLLGVMTGILYDDAAFVDWWYLKDPTHVCFYRPETMRWIAAAHGWTVEFPRENVVIFQKAGGQ
jgi:hypothetical protein